MLNHCATSRYMFCSPFSRASDSDEIALAQRHIIPVKREDFQVWDLKVNADQKALLTCGDGNGREVYSKRIAFTDFPEPGIRFDFYNDTLLLPGEY